MALEKIVVFGGTGAQAGPIVRGAFAALSATGKYKITVPTRNTSSAEAEAVAALPHVAVIEASYDTENGLRTAFRGQDACYFIINSFATREGDECFWSFRAYEIAAQSGLKLFVYSGAVNRYREQFGYQEEFRNSHNLVKANVADWLHQQDAKKLPWAILYGGPYAEMLGSTFCPRRSGDEYIFAAPVNEDSIIPLMALDNYGATGAWIFEHPSEAAGRWISAGAFHVTLPEIVETFRKVTGKQARFVSIPQEKWFEGAAAKFPVDKKLPVGKASDYDDATFTFRQTFSAWWSMWRDNRGTAWPEGTIHPPLAIESLEEWMRKTDYQGEPKEPTKMRREMK
ncbi:hypothetical protein CERZMDRAFT_46186 [Cercospora zeae-maydis SCOH1-5]|uniref:NmrA-like domain-containing protein n=1 Tax=Cercospora zeae-maydis SCOH1-5 TaxID=717836 RepID=A0A6A6F986_9PEZI|nr:hypothetical protein CERZMDRAFT_46186 [Cercospora zeae-maydis SCOH1-5]